MEAHSHGSRVELSVTDDGVGLPEDLASRKSKSLGLQIVEILVRQFRGTWELKRHAGTTFHLTFPER
jgi:two-component sensor histidine kinase